jgi:hypothetical protein
MLGRIKIGDDGYGPSVLIATALNHSPAEYVPRPSICLLYRPTSNLGRNRIEQNGGAWSSSVACDRDLEGVVAKWKRGGYGDSWWKIRNPSHMQYEGRHELFEKHAAAVGWAGSRAATLMAALRVDKQSLFV